jgi:hypothetical protein
MLPMFAKYLAKMINKVVIGAYVHVYGTRMGVREA